MSLFLARFREPMAKVAKDRRALRRSPQQGGQRFRFSHISRPPLTTPPSSPEPIFVRTKTGERYTQSEVFKFFGLRLAVPKRFRTSLNMQRTKSLRTAALAAELGVTLP